MKYLVNNVKCLKCTTADCKKKLYYNYIQVEFSEDNMECDIYLSCLSIQQIFVMLKTINGVSINKHIKYLNRPNVVRRVNTDNGFIIYYKKPCVGHVSTDMIIETQFNRWLNQKYLKGTCTLNSALDQYKYSRNRSDYHCMIKYISNAMCSFYNALDKCYNIEKWNNFDKANLSITEIKEFIDIFIAKYFKRRHQIVKGAILNIDGYLYVMGYCMGSNYQSSIKVDMNTKSIIEEYGAHDCPVRLLYGKYDNLYKN